MKNLLIIFVKNLIIGNVKSRLAKSIGEEKALLVYKKLLLKTNEIVVDLNFDKCVCYSESIDQDDIWKNSSFLKSKQKGDDLGVRMRNAFNDGFENSYDKICLIGSDIMELTDEIIVQAYDHLDAHDIVLGPSLDGGYYLIGMKSPVSYVFENKEWGTEEVLKETLSDINKMNLKYFLLPTLNDIDEIEDINDSNREYLFS